MLLQLVQVVVGSDPKRPVRRAFCTAGPGEAFSETTGPDSRQAAF